LWGPRGAVQAWLGAIVVTGLAAWQASVRIGTQAPTLALLAVLAAACIIVARRVVRTPTSGSGKLIEVMSGVWTVLMYISLGAGAHRGGLPVPPWFVLSVSAFEDSLMPEQRADLAHAPDAASLARVLDRISLPPRIGEALERAVRELCPDGESVAVRSSASDE